MAEVTGAEIKAKALEGYEKFMMCRRTNYEYMLKEFPNDKSFNMSTPAYWDEIKDEILAAHPDDDWWWVRWRSAWQNMSKDRWGRWWVTEILSERTKDDWFSFERFLEGARRFVCDYIRLIEIAETREEEDKRYAEYEEVSRALSNFGIQCYCDGWRRNAEGHLVATRVFVALKGKWEFLVTRKDKNSDELKCSLFDISENRNRVIHTWDAKDWAMSL